MDWLRTTLQDNASVSVTYTRGAYSVTLDVVLGQTRFASNSPNKARVEYSDRDYLITAAELVLNGSVVDPADGDRITEVVNGTSMIFEIMPPRNTDEPAARPSGPDRQTWRVHCKRVS